MYQSPSQDCFYYTLKVLVCCVFIFVYANSNFYLIVKIVWSCYLKMIHFIFYLMCICACLHVWLHRLCDWCLWGSKKDTGSSGNGVTDGCSTQVETWTWVSRKTSVRWNWCAISQLLFPSWFLPFRSQQCIVYNAWVCMLSMFLLLICTFINSDHIDHKWFIFILLCLLSLDLVPNMGCILENVP